MRKGLTLVLAAMMAVALTACGGRPAAGSAGPSSLPGAAQSGQAPDGGASEGPESSEVCYLPVRITGSYDIPREAEEKLGRGSCQETVAAFEYDDRGRITGYAAGSLTLAFQYLDEIALPRKVELEDGREISFTEPRWSQDGGEILLDVSASGDETLPGDFRLTELQRDGDGKLAAAVISWESQLGEETFFAPGHTFDENGNLLFVPTEGLEYKYRYGDEGRAAGFELWSSLEGDAGLLGAVRVDEWGRPVSVEYAFGDADTYEDMGNGTYRCGTLDGWTELTFDEAGNFIRCAWYYDVSGITYTYEVEYISMPVSRYAGTPVDYTNAYPLLHYASQGRVNSCAHAAGWLQLPVVSQLWV